jgi:hypothetical protein
VPLRCRGQLSQAASNFVAWQEIRPRPPCALCLEIEIGRKYKCDHFGKQYFGIVKEKRDGQIGVVLGSKVETDDMTVRPGLRELLWLEPKDFHPL